MQTKTIVLGVMVMVALTGCAKKAQQSAVDTALDTQASQSTTGESSSAESSTSAGAGTQAPATMPSELLVAGATISASVTVADGYQATFTARQTTEQLTTYYKGLADWKVAAEFATDATKSLSLEKSDQRVVITMTPKGSDSADVVVTGSLVKE